MIEFMKLRKHSTDQLDNFDDSLPQNTVLKDLEDSLKQYEEQRKRDLEKRATNIEIPEPAKTGVSSWGKTGFGSTTGGFGSSTGGFGANKTTTTGFGLTQNKPATNTTNTTATSTSTSTTGFGLNKPATTTTNTTTGTTGTAFSGGKPFGSK